GARPIQTARRAFLVAQPEGSSNLHVQSCPVWMKIELDGFSGRIAGKRISSKIRGTVDRHTDE
ncbi:MAG: hypothetical protein ABR991_08085, partial [Terracidiphilus sp.]